MITRPAGTEPDHDVLFTPTPSLPIRTHRRDIKVTVQVNERFVGRQPQHRRFGGPSRLDARRNLPESPFGKHLGEAFVGVGRGVRLERLHRGTPPAGARPAQEVEVAQ